MYKNSKYLFLKIYLLKDTFKQLKKSTPLVSFWICPYSKGLAYKFNSKIFTFRVFTLTMSMIVGVFGDPLNQLDPNKLGWVFKCLGQIQLILLLNGLDNKFCILNLSRQ